jgi:hypothetical protein
MAGKTHVDSKGKKSGGGSKAAVSKHETHKKSTKSKQTVEKKVQRKMTPIVAEVQIRDGSRHEDSQTQKDKHTGEQKEEHAMRQKEMNNDDNDFSVNDDDFTVNDDDNFTVNDDDDDFTVNDDDDFTVEMRHSLEELSSESDKLVEEGNEALDDLHLEEGNEALDDRGPSLLSTDVPSEESSLLQLNAQGDAGQWPPTQGWLKGSVQPAPSPRSRGHAPMWPGVKRSPSFPFQGNDKFDGGRAMQKWMKGHKVAVPQQMKMQHHNFDFKRLERETANSDDKPDTVGQWPPTNGWVKGNLNGA